MADGGAGRMPLNACPHAPYARRVADCHRYLHNANKETIRMKDSLFTNAYRTERLAAAALA